MAIFPTAAFAGTPVGVPAQLGISTQPVVADNVSADPLPKTKFALVATLAVLIPAENVCKAVHVFARV